MNWTDYAIIALLAFSCAAGLMRGLLREVISLLSWLVAVWLAWKYSGLLEPYLGGALRDSPGHAWAARAVIFVGVLLLGAAVGAFVTHFVRLSLFSGVDRLLGFMFGLLRGIVAVGLLAMLCQAARLNEEPWYRNSTLVPYADQSGNVLRALVGEGKMRAASVAD